MREMYWKGELPKSRMKLVQAWIEIHKDELIADWRLAAKGLQLSKIEPLKRGGVKMVKVISVEAIKNHKLRVLLSNNKKGIFDVSPYLDKGIFRELRDPHYFRRVQALMRESCGPMSRTSVLKPLNTNCNESNHPKEQSPNKPFLGGGEP